MIQKIDNFLEKFSVYSVIACVFTMLTLSMINIIFRQFEITFLWIEPVVRHLVFLATFLGGAIATGEGQHIKIDLIARLLENQKNEKLKKYLERIIVIGTMVAVNILIYSSYELVQLELEDSNIAFLGIKTGYLIGIICFGMVLIQLRLLLRFLLSFKK